MAEHNGRDHEGLPSSGCSLVQEWATAIGTTVQVPMSSTETRHYLEDLLHRLEIALAGPAVDTRAISEVGAELVAEDFTEPQSLSRTVEVLARQLPTALFDSTGHDGTGHDVPELHTAGNPLPKLLGALVAGYLEALRNRIFHQQQWVKRALLADQHDLQRDVQISQTRFSELFDLSEVGIAISKPDGSIVRTNPSLDEILGYLKGELPGRELREVFVPENTSILQQHYRRLLKGDQSRVSVPAKLLRKNGETAWVDLTFSVLHDDTPAPQYVATMVHDNTELHLLRKQFAHHLLHDLQTDLPNRSYFVSHLNEVLELLAPSAVITLLQLSLDGFTALNEGLGHRFGDQVLNLVARRLESVVARHTAMVARLDHDEYAILIRSGESAPDVGRLAETINSVLAQPCYLEGHKVALTATIGIVQRQVAAAKTDEMLRDVGSALRRSQRMGGRQWAMFDTAIDGADVADLRLAVTLTDALDDGRLRVDYQPVVSLDGGRLVGVEATLCWQHPELGELPHERCMQLAERTSAVRAVGQWLLHTAAHQARSWWERMGPDLPPIVIALTHHQAQDPDLVAQVRKLLTHSGIRPQALELRVPMTALRPVPGLQAREAGMETEATMQILAELGVRMSLHDFNGGLDRLTGLADLPVQAVRIAPSMGNIVASNPSGLQAQALRAVVGTMRTVGLRVIACRVDTEGLAQWWRSAGAECAVGTLVGPPSPLQDIERLLR